MQKDTQGGQGGERDGITVARARDHDSGTIEGPNGLVLYEAKMERTTEDRRSAVILTMCIS